MQQITPSSIENLKVMVEETHNELRKAKSVVGILHYYCTLSVFSTYSVVSKICKCEKGITNIPGAVLHDPDKNINKINKPNKNIKNKINRSKTN